MPIVPLARSEFCISTLHQGCSGRAIGGEQPCLCNCHEPRLGGLLPPLHPRRQLGHVRPPLRRETEHPGRSDTSTAPATAITAAEIAERILSAITTDKDKDKDK